MPSPNEGGAPDAAALSGIRVLDLSRVLAGPWASQTLGDLGAEVIKVEQPGRGDDTRAWGPPFWDEAGSEQRLSAYYLCCNRNKKSVAIDIADPAGARLVQRLAQTADIVIENFKVGGLARYGLDYDVLRAVNPRLIYCSITGFGQTGPYANRGGYDFLVQGMSGLMSVTGQPEGEPGGEPMKTGLAISDLFTGLYATLSILAALHHRERSGEGQHIDCALLDTQVALLANQGMNWLVGGRVPERLGNSHPNIVPYRSFAARDGHVIVAVGNDRQFQALCVALEEPSLADDPRYRSNEVRLAHRDGLEARLAARIALLPADGLLERLTAAGVPCGPVNCIDQVFDDPQVRARGLVQTLDAAGGRVPTLAFPARLSATPATYRNPPPQLGEHTEAVLRERLHLDDDELVALAQRGVLQGTTVRVGGDRA